MGNRSWKVVAFGCAIGFGVFAAVLTANPTGREADLLDLGSADKAVRKAAVDRLGNGGAAVVTELIGRLDDPHSSLVRAGLVQSIRKAGGPAGSDATAVKGLLSSSDLSVRHAAVLTLIENPGIARVELTQRLSDSTEDPLVRRAAAHALGQAGAQSRATLSKFASDQNEPAGIRKAAIRALVNCGNPGLGDVENIAKDGTRDRSEREVAIRALADVGATGNGALTRLTADATAFVRAHATAGIGRSGGAADGPTLVAMLADPVANVRIEALRALEGLGLEVANIGAIVVCLGDADVRLQSLSCQIIERTKAPAFAGIQPQLRGLVASPTFRVRYDAALALAAFDDNFGAAQMAIDKGAGSLSQRRMASDAHALITGKGK